jgi:hypothetical protein
VHVRVVRVTKGSHHAYDEQSVGAGGCELSAVGNQAVGIEAAPAVCFESRRQQSRYRRSREGEKRGAAGSTCVFASFGFRAFLPFTIPSFCLIA